MPRAATAREVKHNERDGNKGSSVSSVEGKQSIVVAMEARSGNGWDG